MQIVISALIPLAVAACARTPDAIAPVSMGTAYAGIDCSRAVVGLAALDGKQRSAIVGDAFGAPVSSLAGMDVEGQTATEKGKILALDARLMSCGS